MKKLLSLTLTLASLGIVASTAEAKSTEAKNVSSPTVVAAATSAPQWRRGRGWRRRARITTRARIVRVGRHAYRETYQVTYFPNGRTQTRLISRVRIS